MTADDMSVCSSPFCQRRCVRRHFDLMTGMFATTVRGQRKVLTNCIRMERFRSLPWGAFPPSLTMKRDTSQKRRCRRARVCCVSDLEQDISDLPHAFHAATGQPSKPFEHSKRHDGCT